MKFYSEITKKLYDSESQLKTDEKKISEAEAAKKAAEAKKASERAARAKEVENAYKAKVAAENTFIDLRNKFVKDYGSFHMTVTEQSPLIGSSFTVNELLDKLFNI